MSSEMPVEPSNETLFRAWQAGDPEAGADICLRYAGFIANCAITAANKPGHDTPNPRVDGEDLLQVGAESVLQRAKTCSPDKDFRRYQRIGVVRDIARTSRRQGGAVELPTEGQPLFAKYWEETENRLHQGQPPLTTSQIADLLGLAKDDRAARKEPAKRGPKTVRDFRRADALINAESIEALFGTASELPASAISLTTEQVWWPQTETEVMQRQTIRFVHELIDRAFATNQLDPDDSDMVIALERRKATIILLYGLDGGDKRSLEEIASALHVTVNAVKTISTMAHVQLRAFAKR